MFQARVLNKDSNHMKVIAERHTLRSCRHAIKARPAKWNIGIYNPDGVMVLKRINGEWKDAQHTEEDVKRVYTQVGGLFR